MVSCGSVGASGSSSGSSICRLLCASHKRMWRSRYSLMLGMVGLSLYALNGTRKHLGTNCAEQQFNYSPRTVGRCHYYGCHGAGLHRVLTGFILTLDDWQRPYFDLRHVTAPLLV